MTVIRHVDSSGMLYSYAGSLDSFLDLRLYYVQLEVLSRFLEISLSLSLSLSLWLFEFEDQLCDFILQRAYLISSQCPFGRIIYMFQYKNASFLRQLQSEITAVNAGALELDATCDRDCFVNVQTFKVSTRGYLWGQKKKKKKFGGLTQSLLNTTKHS